MILTQESQDRVDVPRPKRLGLRETTVQQQMAKHQGDQPGDTSRTRVDEIQYLRADGRASGPSRNLQRMVGVTTHLLRGQRPKPVNRQDSPPDLRMLRSIQ